MTSNVGAKMITDQKRLGFTVAKENDDRKHINMKSKVMDEVKNVFKPEFLNRIDDIIVFHMLNKEHIKQIADLSLNELIKRVKDATNIIVKIKDEAKDYIAEKGYSATYGARPLRRLIQTEIENKLASFILKNKIKNNSITIDFKDNELIFK